MKPPDNAEIFETPLSTAWLDENGILCMVSKTTERTIENYKPLIELYKKLTEKKNKICILADASKAAPLNKEVRDYLNAELPKYVSAMAIISETALGRMIANIFVKLRPTSYHFKMFDSTEKAKEWLKHYL